MLQEGGHDETACIAVNWCCAANFGILRIPTKYMAITADTKTDADGFKL